jgi:hypothetical protein
MKILNCIEFPGSLCAVENLRETAPPYFAGFIGWVDRHYRAPGLLIRGLKGNCSAVLDWFEKRYIPRAHWCYSMVRLVHL